ncbi:MAG TPA: zinc ribbon domain-containing protein [Candidatus Nanoarchaeia archaeon]|nr:zinc ribbon domain-containing protein [Candidatus Nanoarchaeia archaeon]
MLDKPRCQSCGMPIMGSFFGSNADGSQMQDYCKFCFKKGAFLEPTVTLQVMIVNSVTYMTKTLNIPRDKAMEMARAVIPTLKRWQK